MGRPVKKGLDYFPLDVALDTKLNLIKAEFGLLGFGIVIRLFQYIYGENGYYMEWSQDVALMFASKESVGVNAVSEVVNACLKRGIFDQSKFKEFGILTSKGIQERYLEATDRRIGEKICNKYAVLNVPKKAVNDGINGINVDINRVNVNRKYTNKSKVNKSKVNKTYRSIIADYTSNLDLRSSLENFVEMRNKMKGFTLNALKILLKNLDKLASDDLSKIEIVNQSIERSWKGFFPVKQKSPFTSRRQDVLPDYYQQMKAGSDPEVTDETDFDREEFEEIRRQLREQEEQKK
ncbi:DUF4373 domain-containing protein [Holdemania sp. 1001302B_160321_E10]|uniref:DUF4373 domain-containing protein n=1 Tax=Holdemania sp. 1001302B_160321_E10 TaxID=2787120 RepID=UPI00189AEBA3|nr:DUF4373 domain-containing protein [Holdemania sp. 1001302B_160321_E10]